MKATEYQQFCQNIEKFHSENNLRPGCNGPENGESEPFFSWRRCGCCQSVLGGNRTKYSFAAHNGEIIKEEICDDCVYFLAYGRLDDQTMMEIEKSV